MDYFGMDVTMSVRIIELADGCQTASIRDVVVGAEKSLQREFKKINIYVAYPNRLINTFKNLLSFNVLFFVEFKMMYFQAD